MIGSVVGLPVAIGLAIGIVTIILFSGLFPNNNSNSAENNNNNNQNGSNNNQQQQYQIIIATSPSLLSFLNGTGSNSAIEIPEDFAVIYSFGVREKNVLDTRNGSYRADMVDEPSITIPLKLSNAELQKIWQSAMQNNFFQLKNMTEECERDCIKKIPEITYTLQITSNGITHTVKSRENYLYKQQDLDYSKFNAIRQTIDNILHNRTEIQNLPHPKTGYS